MRVIIIGIILSAVILSGCTSQADKDYLKITELENNDRYDEAIKLAETCIAHYPGNYRFYTERGYCRYVEKNIPAARADIEKCLQLKENNARCTALMGLINEAEGHVDAAETYLLNAISLEYNKSAKSVYYRHLGDYYYRSKKDVPKALSQYTESLRLYKWNGATYYNMGSVLLAVNQKEFAEQRWLKGLEIAEYPEARFKHKTYYGLAYLYNQKRDFWKAKEMVTKALKLAPREGQYLQLSKEITNQLKS